MPTLLQLQSEPWWGREVVTPELDWLGDEICRRTGRPRTAAGTKGNAAHLRGAHRSQEWIRNSRYCTNRSYTVQSGLTAEQARHIAGFDFTPGSAEQMIAQCKRILAAMKGGRLNEVREFYGNVDGDQVVDGWDNVRDRAASSDSSHLWHWHLTIDRRQCRNKQLMERILAVALGLEDDMTPDELLTTEVRSSATGVTASVGDLLKQGLELKMIQVPALAAGLAEVQANLKAMAGKDWVDEEAIVSGVLAGLGGRSAPEVAQALVAAGQDPAALAEALTALAQG